LSHLTVQFQTAANTDRCSIGTTVFGPLPNTVVFDCSNS
jgi:hypothetical protein